MVLGIPREKFSNKRTMIGVISVAYGSPSREHARAGIGSQLARGKLDLGPHVIDRLNRPCGLLNFREALLAPGQVEPGRGGRSALPLKGFLSPANLGLNLGDLRQGGGPVGAQIRDIGVVLQPIADRERLGETPLDRVGARQERIAAIGV
jgi:hypothetical protein